MITMEKNLFGIPPIFSLSWSPRIGLYVFSLQEMHKSAGKTGDDINDEDKYEKDNIEEEVEGDVDDKKEEDQQNDEGEE